MGVDSTQSIGLPFALIAAVGCASMGAQPTSTAPPAERAVAEDSLLASQVYVGLRITPDADDASVMRLVAVVHDLDGRESVTDLGTYSGGIAVAPNVGDELVRVSVGEGDDARAVRLIRSGDYVEARRTRRVGDTAGTEDELIDRIVLPRGAPVRAREPVLERNGTEP